MDKLKSFQEVAFKNGFVEAEEVEDGTVLWLRKPTASAEDRMCIDTMTNSATVFWASIPWKINSKTFRSASLLQDWFLAAAKTPAKMTNRETLLRLSANKSDSVAMVSLCENNAELIRVAMVRYFAVGPASEKAKSMVMLRVAERARSYEAGQDADQWLVQSVNAECDRLRNEAIQAKANSE
jgi:hypothetical protein